MPSPGLGPRRKSPGETKETQADQLTQSGALANATLGTCDICCEEDLALDKFLLCVHEASFCIACLRTHVKTRLMDRALPTCLALDCKVQPHYTETIRMLKSDPTCSANELEKHREALHKLNGSANRSSSFCPNCNTLLSIFGSTKFVICGICDQNICCLHVHPAHRQYQQAAAHCCDKGALQALHQMQKQDQTSRERFAELIQMELWKELHCRLCPNCRRCIQKLDGCDLMKCGGDFHGYNNLAHTLLCQCLVSLTTPCVNPYHLLLEYCHCHIVFLLFFQGQPTVRLWSEL